MPIVTPLPVGATIAPNSLRASMEARRARGERFSLAEAIAIVVPLSVEASKLHQAGDKIHLHPSAVTILHDQPAVVMNAARQMPTLPRDKAVLAPEERSGQPGDKRASVFSIGAILYELVTGESVGPGMRRPTDIVRDLPAALEVVLGKALVSEPGSRPDDLLALAQALHHLAPSASMAPPAADESHLDGDADFEVDIRLSMLPPQELNAPLPKGYVSAALAPPPTPSGDVYGLAVRETAALSSRSDPTSRLADLKARLESDPRPRYVVIADGMDHGPFSAVELLQQVGTGSFKEDHLLRDTFSKEERNIKDWDEFAPFAEQAKLNREIKQEKVALEETITQERKATTSKALIGGLALAAVVAVGVGFFLVKRGARKDDVEVQGDKAVSVDSDGGVKAGAKAGPSGGGVGGRLPTQGAFPVLPGGQSCEGAQAKYVEEMKMGEKGQADLTANQFAGVLNNGSYLNSCSVPASTEVNICAAVQNGRAVGVTVTMNPSNPSAAACVAGRVRGLSFPSNPKLDIARTSFK